MTPDFSGKFQQWNLTEAEVKAALDNHLLLAYLQNKRALHADALVGDMLRTREDLQDIKELVRFESRKAHIQILDELINEIVEIQSQAGQDAEASHS